MRKSYFGYAIASFLFIIIALAGISSYRGSVKEPLRKPNNFIGLNKEPYRKLEVGTAIRWPGEFEKQEAIWLQWPSGIYNEGDLPINPAMIRVIKAFAPYVRVNIAAASSGEISTIKSLLAGSGYTGTNVHYYIINHYSIWTRDVGPIFVRDSQNNLRVVDFKFNNYSRDGSQFYINVEGQVHRLIANKFNLPLVSTSLTSEGGAIESNGKGTMMVTESVALKRNPSLTKLQIENEYKRVLGLKKVIWLKKGLAEDDRITGGHINEVARFANPNTILLAQILPRDRYATSDSQESYRRLEENFQILKNATDQDGNPFRIIRIPMPTTLFKDTNASGLPIRSYINYAVTNGAVIFQTYWRPGRSSILRDTEAGVKEIFKGVFPGRTVVGVDAESINMWGGGIHCISQHMPFEY